jgi:ABC-type multidrug transport system ATPase subunit
MSLLELERVSKHAGRAESDRRSVLQGASLRVEEGELVAVWGSRRSGRSTLLRIAAGITQPDGGVVRFQGRDLARCKDHAQDSGIAYCLTKHPPSDWQVVRDQLVTDQLMRGERVKDAERCAGDVLARTGAEGCAGCRLDKLGPDEAVRVAVARALLRSPKLLLIDEPTLGVDVLVRDELLRLLRSLTEEGIAVLMTTGDSPCLSFAHRRLSLDAGTLHGDSVPGLASVLPFRRSA